MASTMYRHVWLPLPPWLNSSSSSPGGSLWLKLVLSLKFTTIVSNKIRQLHLWATCGEPFLFIIKLLSNLYLPDMEPCPLLIHMLTMKSKLPLEALCSQELDIVCCCLSSKNRFLSECCPLGWLQVICDGNLINRKLKTSSLLIAQKLLLMAAVTWSTSALC